jgi:hypothetical protein
MSKLEVNAVEPQCGTNLTLGASGDTIIIPSGATISNQGTAAGFGPTGAVSWNTTKVTTGFTAVTGVGYFADTTSAAFTITLPATPAAGAVVGISDYANTFATNNLTVGRNSSNIGGVANNAILSTNGLSVTFVYVDATQGWIVTDSGNRSDLPVPEFVAATGGCIATSGNYKIHTFTGPGTFTVTNDGNPLGSSTVDYLVVAGGGGGGGVCGGGGGGAGGFRESVPSPAAWTASPLASSTSLPVSVTGYPITVGGGGTASGPSNNNPGGNGSNSVFSTITSAGGGGGNSFNPKTAGSGGSGGGGGGRGSCGTGTGGSGNTPPVAPPQGNNGGNSTSVTSPPAVDTGGGGGGATAVGANGTANGPGGAGGAGATTSISGSPTAYSGGGGGGSELGTGGTGGTGGGANGGTTSNPVSGGTVNKGGGGGGIGTGVCGGNAGGSGIVIIRYKFQ